STDRPIRIMLPMVTVQAEIDATRTLIESCRDELLAQGIATEVPPLGIMVETPAAAIAIDRLDAAFYSIGSNDLIQYVMAASRDAAGRVSNLLDPGHPAIAWLIEQVACHGRVRGLDVSLCGDMASDPAFLPMLLQVGLRKISVAPAMLDRVKQAIRDIDLKGRAPGA
ncbi:MAG: putative PEP-binding protein, partial [Geminicoccaceae bacterium]